MSSTPIVAIVSGLIGALVSAYLSYIVRLKAKHREDSDERKRLAHVNFLLLTNVVAADFFIKDFSEKLVNARGIKMEGYGLPHATAVFFATRAAEMSHEDISHVQLLLKPFIRAAIGATENFEIDQSNLGRMKEVAIYAYYGCQTAMARLKAALDLLDVSLEKGDPRLLDATVFHSVFRAYREYADAAGILRAALQNSAELSSEYSVKCLNRSFAALKAEISASFEHNAKLELAKKAADAATAPSPTEMEVASGSESK
ncbi:hypothetical protein [Paraburkholderia elongata]|uniref:Transmembrane protein n=1 Tax=Paraburkholderia elongata TaxID=2675747 RepID=A0A972SLU9_9BURK|nr:hypothetical protein [Paraburkholderia elongata]NPT60493.1 hypothetical protein [Paraburkholderia elongata]